MTRWPRSIEISLCPYTLQHPNHIRNWLPNKEDGTRTPLSKNIRENHAFGCTVYSLQKLLQAGRRIIKWNPRGSMWIHLGTFTRNASSISRILIIETSMVSNKFHIQHKYLFEALRPKAVNIPDEASNRNPGLRIQGLAYGLIIRGGKLLQ